MKKVILFLKMLLSLIVPYSKYYRIETIKPDTPTNSYQSELTKFESEFEYPFSDTETFTIMHGKDGDYLSFFKQLGEPYYFIARNKKYKFSYKNGINATRKKDEIAGTCCAVLRNVPFKNNINYPIQKLTAWYLCDLKVSNKYQGEHLPMIMMQHIAAKRFLQCPRGFGICMNPPSGEPKAAKIFKNHGPFHKAKTQTLNIYTLTKEQALESEGTLKSALVSNFYMKESDHLTYVSTQGMKDYTIFDAAGSKPWNLLHICPSLRVPSQQTTVVTPQDDTVHMICAVQGSKLEQIFTKFLGKPSSTAQIISYGMQDIDFNFLTTNQI